MRALIAGSLLVLSPPIAAAEWQQVQVGGVSARLVAGGPGGAGGRPLLLVLHGCAQSNAALQQRSALGAAAEAAGAVVVLPQVPGGGVLAGCWDYYGAAHTRGGRHTGPLLSLVAGLLEDADLAIDPDRVWIAGLSSGAGQALVTACLAPDVFSGVALAGGPGLGTEAGQIAQVSSTPATTTTLCERLAGPQAEALARQRAVLVTGDRDFIVAPGYARVNAEGLAALYGATQQMALDLATLPGAPAGTGRLWLDAQGPRVALLEVAGLDHAWPGGAGSGPTREFVAQGGLDLGAWLLAFFGDRVVPEGPEDPQPDPETPVDPETSGECPAVEGTLVDHTSRLAVYNGAYGAADLSYVELLARYGVSTPFPLYQGPDGRWYHDPTGLDCGAPAPDGAVVPEAPEDAGRAGEADGGEAPIRDPEPAATDPAGGCHQTSSSGAGWWGWAALGWAIRSRRRSAR